ncbi:MAG: SUMF1/EgtB/PvdO family nonheme iron enzyme, partial [Opitutales bacterium]|nr:SUMF1/EgtB/PvdO family nonheme iron enzyme [Opitutales bacterium]
EQDPWCEIRGAGVVLEPLIPKSAVPARPVQVAAAQVWHVLRDGAPMVFEDAALKERLWTGSLKAEELVWRVGSTEWLPAKSIAELAAFLPTPPSAPPQAAGPQMGRSWILPDIGLELVWMDPPYSPNASSGESADPLCAAQQPELTVAKGFWLGKHPVTREEFQSITGKSPAGMSSVGRLPVTNVGWKCAMGFCDLLNKRNREQLPKGYRFSLPTEMEWEHACRAGSSAAFCFGEGALGLEDFAWYANNSGGKTHPVGKKRANAWGLHDVHGNVWEWCADWIGKPGSFRVYRGGAWNSPLEDCRASVRRRLKPDYRNAFLGFRLALRYFEDASQSVNAEWGTEAPTTPGDSASAKSKPWRQGAQFGRPRQGRRVRDGVFGQTPQATPRHRKRAD